MISVKGDWQEYDTQLFGRPTKVRINKGLKKQAPVTGFGSALKVNVYCRIFPMTGLIDPEEAHYMEHIEEDLLRVAGEHLSGLCPLRITTKGMREYTFYIDGKGDYRAAVGDLRALYPDYRIERVLVNDAGWDHYRRHLPRKKWFVFKR